MNTAMFYDRALPSLWSFSARMMISLSMMYDLKMLFVCA